VRSNSAGTDKTDAVLKKMREIPINDVMTKNGRIREDGRVMRDMYLFEAKKPADSKSDWDLLKKTATISAEDAASPLSDSACPLIKKSGTCASEEICCKAGDLPSSIPSGSILGMHRRKCIRFDLQLLRLDSKLVDWFRSVPKRSGN